MTEAFLSQFPARDLDEPITKEYLRAELGDLRTELKGDIKDLRTEMHQLVNRLYVAMISVAAVIIAAVGLMIVNFD